MAHTYLNKSQLNAQTGTSISHTHTTGGRATVICLSISVGSATGRTGGAPTIDGTTATQADIVRTGIEVNTELWYVCRSFPSDVVIVVPNAGALSCNLEVVSATAGSGFLSAIQGSSGNANADSTGDGWSINVTSSAVGDFLYARIGCGENATASVSQTAGSPTKTLTYGNVHTAATTHTSFGYYAASDGAGTETFTWTWSNDDGAGNAAVFKSVTDTGTAFTPVTTGGAVLSVTGTTQTRDCLGGNNTGAGLSAQVAEGTYTYTPAAGGTDYIPVLEQADGWRCTGGVSTVYFDIDPDGIRTPWSFHEVGEETYVYTPEAGGTDYVPDLEWGSIYVVDAGERAFSLNVPAAADGFFSAASIQSVDYRQDGVSAWYLAAEAAQSVAFSPETVGQEFFTSAYDIVIRLNYAGEVVSALSVGEGTYSAQLLGANDYIPDLAWAALYVSPGTDAYADRQYEGVSTGSFAAQADSSGSGYFEGTAAETFFSAPTVKGDGYYEGDTAGSFTVGEDTYSASLTIQTVVLEGDVRWKLTGGVSSVVLDIDPAGIWTPWAAYEVGEGTSTISLDIADDIQEEGHAAIKIVHPTWHTFSMVRSMDVLWQKFVVATDYSSNIKEDVFYAGDVAAKFSPGTDHVFVGKLTIVLDGISDFKVDAAHDRYVDRTYEGTSASKFSAGENTYTANVAVNHMPDTVATVFLIDGFLQFYDMSIAIGTAFEEGNAFGPFSYRSETRIEVRDSSGVPAAAFSSEAGAEYTSLLVNVSKTGDAAVSLTSDTEYAYNFSAGNIAVVGDAAASFAAEHTKDISPVIGVTAFLSALHTKDIYPETGTTAVFSASSEYRKSPVTLIHDGDARWLVGDAIPDGAWTDETQDGATTYPVQDGALALDRDDYHLAEVSVGWAPTIQAQDFIFSAAHDVSTTEGVVLQAEYVGDVAGIFSLSTDLRVSKVPEVENAIVFGVAGAVVYTYVPPVVVGPYTTTWVCAPKPVRGTSQDGAWTELDQDGAWVENVGFSMSEGSEWGAYTQDDAYPYTYLRKPNVFDLTESKISLTASTESLPGALVTLEGKVTASTTDEPEPTSSI